MASKNSKDNKNGRNGNSNKKAVKKKNVWRIPELRKRIETLILDGSLLSGGYDGIYETIRTEFAEQLKEPGYMLDKPKFRRKVSEFLWPERVLKQLRDAIRHQMDMETVCSRLSYIPPGQFLYKWNQLKGKAPESKRTEFVRGVGRLAQEISTESDEPFEFPKSTFDDPYPISLVGKNPFIAFLNGVNLGVPYSRVIDENSARQALIVAERRNAAAVVLTNPLDIKFVKASGSGLQVNRARLAGTNINPGVFDEEYAKEVRRIAEKRPHNALIFQTLAERFVDGMQGWAKIATSQGKPVYSGSVVIVLGYKDEAMIDTAAYWEAHYFWQLELNRLNVEKQLVMYQIANARKNNLDTRWLEDELDRITKRIARTRMTNVTDWDFKRYYNKVLRFVIDTLHKTIPNSTVIGMGTSYITLDGKIVEINIPRHTRSGGASNDLLASFCDSYGPRAMRGKLADAVVICHPYALNCKWTKRENDQDGKRGDSDIFVAPIVVDEKHIRNVLSDHIRAVPGIAKSLFTEQFKAGMLCLELVNGTLQPRDWSLRSMQDFVKRAKRKSKKVCPAEPLYIWMMIGTDTHIGSVSREYVMTDNGCALGSVEAVFELMRRENLFETRRFPVHMFVVNDDPVQGHNFPTQARLHPNRMPYMKLERWMNEQMMDMRSASPRRALEIANEMRMVSLRQILIRGEHWTAEQVRMLIDMLIKPHLDFYDALLRRWVASGLSIRGISDISGEIYDTRDPGAINWGSGNHILKSTDGEMVEGFIYAEVLRALLGGCPSWIGKDDLLERLIQAPMYSSQAIAYGCFSTPGGYEWGLELRDSPTKMAGWGDPLAGWVSVDLRRGNYSRIMDERMTLKICGDKHFGAFTRTPWAYYVMGMPSTSTDQFAEGFGGFPPNNTGVVFVGLPAEGPKSGPILVRSLSFQWMKQILEGGMEFDWESFLPNPV